MNRMQMEENASHREAGAREPMSITPPDISHSSAVPAVAGRSESVSRNVSRRLQAFSAPPTPLTKDSVGGWVGN